MKLSTTAICLAACLFSPVQAKGKSKDLNCFTMQGDEFREFGDKVYGASPVRECGKNESDCMVNSQNIKVTEESFLNVTTNEDNTNDIFDIISKFSTLTFEESVSGEFGGGVGCGIGPGNKSYVAWLSEFNCVNGTLGDCFEGLEAGLPVKACEPAQTDGTDGNEKELRGLLRCTEANGTNGPDVKFKPVENSASGLAVDITMLSLFSFLAVGGFWALPSL